MSENQNCWKYTKVVVGVLFLPAVLIVFLVPLSFSYLEYYQYGLKRQKSTGSVDKSEVYSGGRHFIGPDFEFKIFPADLHYVKLDQAKVFTSDKLEVEISIAFQYVIRKEELISLHDAYDLDYEDIMKSSALDALKGAATIYTTRDLIKDRAEVEKTLFKAIRERLGGTCCNSYCNKNNSGCSTCTTVCTPADKGLHVQVKYFQLLSIKIPPEVEQRFVESLVLQENAGEELLKQDAVVVRKETSQKVQFIKNEAAEISQNATAQASLIGSISQANYTAVLEAARSDGLKTVFTELGFTNQTHKNSFDYLRTIRGLSFTHLTVDYQQRIAGNLG